MDQDLFNQVMASFDEEQKPDNAFMRGVKTNVKGAGITGSLVTGDYEGAALGLKDLHEYQRRNQASADQQRLLDAYENADGAMSGIAAFGREFLRPVKEGRTLGEKAKGLAGSIKGAGGAIAEQTPNMFMPMVGMGLGALGGGAVGSQVPIVGTAAGTLAGGFGGASLGNAAVELPGYASESLREAGIDPNDTEAVRKHLEANRGEILKKAGIKGAVIGAVDTATMKLGGQILKKPLEKSFEKFATSAGIDLADKAAVKAAMQSPEFAAHRAADAAYRAANKGARKFARNTAAAALEPGGEYLGEFLGTLAAEGDWSPEAIRKAHKEGVLEAFMSLGQSGITFAGQKGWQYAKEPRGKAAPGAEDAADAPDVPGGGAAGGGPDGGGAGSPIADAFQSTGFGMPVTPENSRMGFGEMTPEMMRAERAAARAEGEAIQTRADDERHAQQQAEYDDMMSANLPVDAGERGWTNGGREGEQSGRRVTPEMDDALNYLMLNARTEQQRKQAAEIREVIQSQAVNPEQERYQVLLGETVLNWARRTREEGGQRGLSGRGRQQALPEPEPVAPEYQPTNEGRPVDEANTMFRGGMNTRRGAEIEQRAATQERLEDAFSQPGTTPRYEAVAQEDADIAAYERKQRRQAAELEREQARIEELRSRTYEPNEVPPELAERLNGMARQMDAGEAGSKHFIYDEEGYLARVDGVKSTNPVWMRQPKTEAEKADADRELLSSVGKDGIRAVLRNWREGRPMTDNQRQVWSALQRKAWKHGTDDYDAQGLDSQEHEDYQYAQKRGMTLEQPHAVAAGSLQDGDTVLVRDREGGIDAATVNDDPSTGTITIKDGVARKYGYDEPVQIEGRKPVERQEPTPDMAMANEAAARDAALAEQAASGTIGKALSAGGILASDQQAPGLGIGPLMQAAPVAAAEDAAELAQNQSALLGLLDAARREQGRAERPQRRQAERQAKAQRVKAAKHRRHEARFAEVGAPYIRGFAGTANWNDIIPNAQGFLEETRNAKRQARRDLEQAATGTSYTTDANRAADKAFAEGKAAREAEAIHESDLRIVRGVLDGDAKMTKRFNAAAGKKKATLERMLEEERAKREGGERSVESGVTGEEQAKSAETAPKQEMWDQVQEQIRKILPDKAQVNAIIGIIEARAKSAGVSAAEFVHRRGLEFRQDFSPRRADGSAIISDDEGVKLGGFHASHYVETGQAIISAYDGANVTVLAHELAHMFRQDLERFGQKELLKAAEKWAGVRSGMWTKAQEEKFARAFERYLREGKAPTNELKDVFAQFKQWLTNIYRVLKGSPINVPVTSEIARVFDALLTENAALDREDLLGVVEFETERQAEEEPRSEAEALAALRSPKHSVVVGGSTYLIIANGLGLQTIYQARVYPKGSPPYVLNRRGVTFAEAEQLALAEIKKTNPEFGKNQAATGENEPATGEATGEAGKSTVPQSEAKPEKAKPEKAKGEREQHVSRKNPSADLPLDYNLPKNTIAGGVKEIGELFDAATDGTIPGNEKRAVRFGVISEAEAKELEAELGIDLTGYRRSIDSFAIKKIIKDHGTEGTETPRGQGGIVREDFRRIPEIVSEYDEVIISGKDGMGNTLIQYKKWYSDGTTYYVEEVRNKRMELTTKTMWKTRTREQMKSQQGNPSSKTPEALRRQSSTGAESITGEAGESKEKSGEKRAKQVQDEDEFLQALQDKGEVVNAVGYTFRLVELKNRPGAFKVVGVRPGENQEVKVTNKGMAREDAAKAAWDASMQVESVVDPEGYERRQRQRQAKFLLQERKAAREVRARDREIAEREAERKARREAERKAQGVEDTEALRRRDEAADMMEVRGVNKITDGSGDITYKLTQEQDGSWTVRTSRRKHMKEGFPNWGELWGGKAPAPVLGQGQGWTRQQAIDAVLETADFENHRKEWQDKEYSREVFEERLRRMDYWVDAHDANRSHDLYKLEQLDDGGFAVEHSWEDGSGHHKETVGKFATMDEAVAAAVADVRRFAKQVAGDSSPAARNDSGEKQAKPDDGVRYSVADDEVAGNDRLVTLHNLSEQSLLFADQLGGLPVPSLGITKAATPYTGFGDISLIGTSGMVDPKRTPVFSADAYSQRFPKPVWAAVKQAKATAFWKKMREFFTLVDDEANLDSVVDRMTGTPPNRTDAISTFLYSQGAKVAYLKSQGRNFEPVTKEAEETQPGSMSPEVQAVVQKIIRDGQPVPRHSDIPALTEALRKWANRTFNEADAKEWMADVVDENGMLYFGTANNIFRYAKRDADKIGKRVVDRIETRKRLEELVPPNDPGFQKFAEENVAALFGEPKIELGGKKVAMTLGNVVKAMISGGDNVRGQEKTMSFGPGQVHAGASRQFRDMDELRGARENVIAPEDARAARTDLDNRMKEYAGDLARYYAYSDTWSAMDDAMRALVEAAQNGGTKAALKTALRKQDFKKVPDFLIEDGVELLQGIRSLMVSYYEAKPQRAVKLSEFAGAVVPSDISPEARAALERAGLKIREYDRNEAGAREKATTALSAELNKERGDVLYQKRAAEATRANGRPARREGESLPDYNRRVKAWNDRRKAEVKAAVDLVKRLVPGLNVRNTADIDGEIGKLKGELPQSASRTAPSGRGPVRHLKNASGLVVGAYHPASRTVLLTADADAATVLHEIGWHAVYDWAKTNAPELHRQMREYAKNAPESVKAWVRQRYGAFSGEGILDEIGARLFTEQGRADFEQAIRDRAGRSWLQKVTDLLRDLWNRFTGAHKADLGAYRGMTPEAAMGRLLADIRAGKRLQGGVRSEERGVGGAEGDMVVRFAKALGVSPEQLQAEYDEVVARYKDTPQWRKAPNGKDSNLNERQWVLVRTPRFKKWFGDWENDPANASKIVDKNGEPMVMYHGTSAVFDAFNTKGAAHTGERATFFTSSPEVAGSYVEGPWVLDKNGEVVRSHLPGGNIVPVFLNVRDPGVWDMGGGNYDADFMRGALKEARKDKNDGAVFTNIRDPAMFTLGRGKASHVVAVFKPTQIKSAVGNTGAFDPNDPDIRYQFLGEQGAAALDAAEEATTRLDNLAVARDMEKAGKDAKTVKLATGWERGKDGKWRYEIDDSGISFHPRGDAYYQRTRPEYAEETERMYILEQKKRLKKAEREELEKLHEKWGWHADFIEERIKNGEAVLYDFVQHKELFKAYPQLEDVRVVFEDMGGVDIL